MPKTAVLLIGFGGPQNADEVRPFLESVLDGVRIPPARFEEVLHHYERVGGVSLYNQITYKQKEALEAWLKAQGSDISVAVGFRHSFPSFKDAFEMFQRYSVEKVIGFILSPLRSYPSFEKYKERVEQGRADAGAPPIEIVYTKPFHLDPLFIDCQAARITAAAAPPKTFTLFSAHSIPVTRSAESGYAEQFWKLSEAVAAKAGLGDSWDVGYQSRSGNPSEPWLEPDVKKIIHGLDPKQFDAVRLVPAGFLNDNVEVTYDLDIEAKEACVTAGVHYFRAAAANDHPLFIEMMGRQVLEAAS